MQDDKLLVEHYYAAASSARSWLQLQTRLLCVDYAEEFGGKNVNTGLWCSLGAAQR